MYLREVICEQVPGREMFILNTPHQLGSLWSDTKMCNPCIRHQLQLEPGRGGGLTLSAVVVV